LASGSCSQIRMSSSVSLLIPSFYQRGQMFPNPGH
jgi:hypothetical protein